MRPHFLNKLLAVCGCLIFFSGCQSSPYTRASSLSYEAETLARSNKCDKAVNIYEEIKKTDPGEPIHTIYLATRSHSSKSLSTCLLEAGRFGEIIKQYEMACVSPHSKVSPVTQDSICSDPSAAYNNNVNRAYQLAGRENPLLKNPEMANLLKKNAEYASHVDSVVSQIYRRIVTNYNDIGTASGAIQYHQKMRDASTKSIEFIDMEILKYKSESNLARINFLEKKKQSEHSELSNHRRKLGELEESRAAAKKIRETTPAILDSVVGAVSAIAGDVDGSSSIQLDGAVADPRFPLKVEFVSSAKLTQSRYYKPLGCVVYVRRTEKKAEEYNVKNICGLYVDYFLPMGRQDKESSRNYDPDKYYNVPANSLQAGTSGNISVYNAGPVLSCLKQDSLKRFHEFAASDIDGFDGLLCKENQKSIKNGPVNTAN